MAVRPRLLLPQCGAVLPVLFLCLLPMRAYAGSFQISPMLLKISARGARSMATYTVQNTGNKAVNIQVSAYRWKQSSNANHYSPAAGLLVIPQILSIPPRQEQLVRVALRKARPARELDYRLHFDEIPPTLSGTNFFGVHTALNINVPLFFMPRAKTRGFRVTLSREKADTRVRVAVHNTGDVYLRVTNLILFNGEGRELGRLEKPLYVLPGATRHWSIRAKKGMPRSLASARELKAFTSQGDKEYPLPPG